MTRDHRPEQRKASPQPAAAMYIDQAIDYTLGAARLVELFPDADAQRNARLLFLAARRLRSRRQAT
jgi:hypothetical protein